MIVYILAKVISTHKDYIIVEHNYSGELIYTPRPQEFISGQYVKLHIYKYINVDYSNSDEMYGFDNHLEKAIFSDLVKIAGLGGKSSLAILKASYYKDLIKLITDGNIETLQTLPYVTNKIANQIVLELQSKYKNYLSASKKIQLDPKKVE